MTRGRISDAPSIKKRKIILKRIDKLVSKSKCENGIRMYGIIRREIATMTGCSDGHISQCFQFTRDGSLQFWESVDGAIREIIKNNTVQMLVEKYSI